MRNWKLIICLVVLACTLQYVTVGVVGEDCGRQGGGGVCANNECCSQYGWCGTTPAHCGTGCQSQCTGSGTPPSPPSGAGAGSVLTRQIFNTFFPHHISFYTYDAFIAAAAAYPTFLTEGTDNYKKRELAAFAAHVSHETSGLVKIEEDGAKGNPQKDYCSSSVTYPCALGKQYYGRGPLQLSWNYNYKRATSSVGVDIYNYPDKVAQDAKLAFKTALWFWTTALDNKPSIHNVMTGKWTPSSSDVAAGRLGAGFGVTIDIINGGLECGPNAQHPDWAQSRLNYYLNFCNQLNVNPGPSGNRGCASMQPYYLTLRSNVTRESSAEE